ncbi:beta-lactamase-like protein [Aspergillus floccosus]
MTCSNFAVPTGTQSVQVRIIDSTARIGKLPANFLMKPPVHGLVYMPVLPAWSFLVEHASGKKVLFDLGVPKDYHAFSPAVTEHLERQGWEVNVDKDVIDILQENEVAADQISSIIWSHWHWDHLGDPSKFPHSTELIVGPGFKKEFLPGYPSKSDSPVRESDFAGRSLREIDFTGASQAGQFRAHDFFRDGSFYILDTPGHAVGHLSGLARTTINPDTFIFMGGDLCHHSGEIRPSKHLRIPAEIPQRSLAIRVPCPGAMYERLLTSRGRSVDEPFFEPAIGLDMEQTIASIVKAQDADASDNVWFVYAHDPSLFGTVDLFPLFANDWKRRNWREQTMWAFLKDFDQAVDRLAQA